MFVIRHKWAVPKSGHEFQFYLAWKHRSITSQLLNRVIPWAILRPFLYNRVYKLWKTTLDRTKIHAQDRITIIERGDIKQYEDI